MVLDVVPTPARGVLLQPVRLRHPLRPTVAVRLRLVTRRLPLPRPLQRQKLVEVKRVTALKVHLARLLVVVVVPTLVYNVHNRHNLLTLPVPKKGFFRLPANTVFNSTLVLQTTPEIGVRAGRKSAGRLWSPPPKFFVRLSGY